MKKRWTALLLCAAMLLIASGAALAAENGDAGFYNVGSAANVEIVPITASGEAVVGVSQDVDGIAGNEQFYPGSEALRVTLTGAAPGKMYILTVSAGSTVYYANQQTGGGTLSFSVAFELPRQRTDMTLSIGSNAVGFTRITIPLSYTPHGESSAAAPSSKPAPSTEPSPQPSAPVEPSPQPSSPVESPREMNTDYEICQKDKTCVMAAFTDLELTAWYHDGVHFALENGIMNGVGNNQFQPNASTSRAMIVTMLWRLEGEPKSTDSMTFRDVQEGEWYAEAVRWAASENLVGGYSVETFAPNDNVSREQLATILCRYAKYKDTDKIPASKINLGIYIDAEHISRWALDGMQWAVDAGLITGVGNEKLSPETDASRAQVATILMRYESNGK